MLMLVELPGDALPEVDICTLEPPVGKAKFQTVYSPLTNIKIQYNINFILIMLFILIYDGEFLILIPAALNFSSEI